MCIIGVVPHIHVFASAFFHPSFPFCVHILLKFSANYHAFSRNKNDRRMATKTQRLPTLLLVLSWTLKTCESKISTKLRLQTRLNFPCHPKMYRLSRGCPCNCLRVPTSLLPFPVHLLLFLSVQCTYKSNFLPLLSRLLFHTFLFPDSTSSFPVRFTTTQIQIHSSASGSNHPSKQSEVLSSVHRLTA